MGSQRREVSPKVTQQPRTDYQSANFVSVFQKSPQGIFKADLVRFRDGGTETPREEKHPVCAPWFH